MRIEEKKQAKQAFNSHWGGPPLLGREKEEMQSNEIDKGEGGVEQYGTTGKKMSCL